MGVGVGGGYLRITNGLIVVPQHASNLEQKQNETENKKVHGDVVKYGSVIQVRTSNRLHVKCSKRQLG